MGRRSVVFDTVLAAVLLAAGQAEAWTGFQATHRQGPHWAQALGYGLAAAALLIRRVHPLRCVLLVCGVLVLEFAVFGAPEGIGLSLIPTVAGYTVANREDRTRALYGLAALAAFGVAWLVFDPVIERPIQYAQGSAYLSILLIGWLLGAYLRTRRLYAAGLARERRERELTAVAEERNRIARELHDVVGHSVSLMTVQASAVRRLMRPDQEKERAALETVEAAGREALTEMRRMVGVLRSGDAPPDLAPPPTLDQLDRLVDSFRQAGLDVVLEAEGERASVPPGLDLTAYRLVQEALTNTLRHAGATRAVVHLGYCEKALLISVRDDGHGPNGSPHGTGLLGMKERVAVYGGTLWAGAAEGGGFVLRAELPLETT
jgi:signal transduction histidine kinase